MNPPSALHSAMSRDRKPFTYTPGGLDLSEIKSQRMAQRLMRNAMNPGVPEVAVHPVNPSAAPTVPVALPNFNCLPVQVFPAMPANPKTLLRTRSNPGSREAPVQRVNPPEFVNNTKFENNDTLYKNTPSYPPQINNNRHMSMYEYSSPPFNTYNAPRLSYGSDGYTAPIAANVPTPATLPISASLPASGHMPAFSYAPVKAPVPAPVFIPTPTPELPEISYDAEFYRIPREYSEPINEQFPKLEINEEKDINRANDSVQTSKGSTISSNEEVKVSQIQDTASRTPVMDVSTKPIEDIIAVNAIADVSVNTSQDVTLVNQEANQIFRPIHDVIAVNPKQEETAVSIPLVTKSIEENAEIDNEQVQIKLLYSYYICIYISVYIVCYTYILYTIKEI